MEKEQGDGVGRRNRVIVLKNVDKVLLPTEINAKNMIVYANIL